MRIRALTLWQPWAELIACGRKTIESRDWKRYMPRNLVGSLLAIHAAKRHDGHTNSECRIFALDDATLDYGAVVAYGEISAVRHCTLADSDATDCDYTGRLGFFLSGVRRLVEPIPWRGRQGFFFVEIPDAARTVQAMSRAIARAMR